MNRRHALTLVAAAPLLMAASCDRKPPVDLDVDRIFADAEVIIANAEAAVDFVESTGFVGAETITQARALIAKARGYVAEAKANLGSGLWKDLANLLIRTLSGIVFSTLQRPAAPGGEAQPPVLTMELRK